VLKTKITFLSSYEDLRHVFHPFNRGNVYQPFSLLLFLICILSLFLLSPSPLLPLLYNLIQRDIFCSGVMGNFSYLSLCLRDMYLFYLISFSGICFMTLILLLQSSLMQGWAHFLLWHCVSKFSVTVTNTWDKSTYEDKCLFWLTVLEISVHGQLVHCLGACSEAVHHGGSVWQRKLLTSWQLGSRQKEREGAKVLVSSSRAHPQWPNFLPLVSISWSFHHLLRLGYKAIHTWTFEGHLSELQQAPALREKQHHLSQFIPWLTNTENAVQGCIRYPWAISKSKIFRTLLLEK
jgi:hypothetical protein